MPKQQTLTGGEIKIETRGRKASANPYRYAKGAYTEDEVFKDRIEERIDLSDRRLRRCKTLEEFKEAVIKYYLKGHSNNPEEFWKIVSRSEGMQDYLEENLLIDKAKDLEDKGEPPIKYYKDENGRRQYTSVTTTKAGNIVVRDAKTGRFVAKSRYTGRAFDWHKLVD